MTMAAAGIDAAHRTGLVHGRLTSDSFVLTADGAAQGHRVRRAAVAHGRPDAERRAHAAADLRAFGQVAFGWSQLAGEEAVRPSRSRSPKHCWRSSAGWRPIPNRRWPTRWRPDQPYESAAELVADLKRVARETPFSDDAWDKLLKHVAENAPDAPTASGARPEHFSFASIPFQ